jgi:hypothetical protein
MYIPYYLIVLIALILWSRLMMRTSLLLTGVAALFLATMCEAVVL